MTYNKPEIVALGEATRTIQGACNSKTTTPSDASVCGGSSPNSNTSAYDLDE